MVITVEKISRWTTDKETPTTKWVGRIDGQFTAEALTKRDAMKWTQQHAEWLKSRS